ncbi:MAG: GtrA family protein [Stellaceae bacterium]
MKTAFRKRTEIAVRYSLFAVAATIINLASQWVGLRIYGGPGALPIAMALGTATGLATKYVLDKRWIFNDLGTGLWTHTRKFSLYTLMGIVTTAVFWGVEFLFDALSPDGMMRFVGGALGLAIGYTIKYRLDNRFVFEAAP